MARTFKVLSIHKQGYPGTSDFNNEAVGTTGTDIEFVDTVTDGSEATIIASLDGHKKVLKNADVGGSNQIVNNITARTSGVVEFWYRSNDITARVNLFLYDSGVGPIVYLRMSANELKYYVGAVLTATGLTMVNDTWYHIKLELYADDTYDYWIDDTQYADGVAVNNNMVSGIDSFRMTTYIHTDYLDAVGYSWDTDYNIGDNVHWRHYFDQDSDFESEDVGTEDISIDWVDTDSGAGTRTVTIIAEFNEHKKILECFDNDGAGRCYVTNNYSSGQTTGTIEFFMKTSDITKMNRFIAWSQVPGVSIDFMIDASKFRYNATVPVDITGITPANDTWYHIRLVFDCTPDTYDIWIDNILYKSAAPFNTVATTLNKTSILTDNTDSGYYSYYDTISYSWTSGNEVADNRIFDYLPYTYTDITTDVKNVLYKNEIYKWREAVLLSEISYENAEVFFQIYDINSKLAMEAEIKNRAQISKDYSYSLRDKNQDDLENRSSNTFSTKKIHDPTDSTSILKVILPNLSEVDGDLILVDADTKTDTYSPTTQNYPDYMMLRDISDLADSVVIVDANGKCYLDDDKASGTALDLDTVADKDKMTEPPLVTDILEDINYFEIFGAMNPDTGTRFTKIIDNTGSDKKKSWRYTNNEFRNQTDVDNYAAALNNRTTTIKNIKFTAQSIGTHNMGETIDYKFVDALYNIPQANYYVIFEEINFDANESTIILSEGMIEQSKYAAEYERPENYNDSYASQIFESDINTIAPEIEGLGTATKSSGFWGLDAVGEGVQFNFFLDSMVDTDRDIVITWGYQRLDGLVDTVNITEHFAHALCNGVNQAWTTVWNAQANILPADALTDFNKFIQTLPNANLTPDSTLYVNWKVNEALRFYSVKSCVVRYYMKREV